MFTIVGIQSHSVAGLLPDPSVNIGAFSLSSSNASAAPTVLLKREPESVSLRGFDPGEKTTMSPNFCTEFPENTLVVTLLIFLQSNKRNIYARWNYIECIARIYRLRIF